MSRYLAIVVIFAVVGIGFVYFFKKSTPKMTLFQNTPHNSTISTLAPTITFNSAHDQYIGSEFKGNYVYAGTINLAWHQLAHDVIKEEIKLDPINEAENILLQKLNNAPFTTKDLNEASYYVKSGYGPETIDLINQEIKTKFPEKSFGDMTLELKPHDIISYAYLFKKVLYVIPFEVQDYEFEGSKVIGFTAINPDQKKNIKVLNYENDDTFIISLQLQDDSDELFLAKGFPMDTPNMVVDEINRLNKEPLASIHDSDWFRAPFLTLDYSHDFQSLIGKHFLNNGFEDYFIGMMRENIKFEMDNKGAKVEAEVLIPIQRSANQKIRKFILDKPFWVIMKRKNSLNPYFIFGIRNSNVMIK